LRGAGLLLAAGFLTAAAVAPILPAQAQVESSGSGGPAASSDVVSSDQSGVAVGAPAQWTAEQMAAAKPYPLPGPSAPSSAPQELGGPTGAPGTSAGNSAAGGGSAGAATESQAGPEVAVPASSGGAQPLTSTYPSPFSRWFWLGPTRVYPIMTVGKLFFNQSGGSFVCSAATVGQDSIWTAGHCLHAGNNSAAGWSTNVLFCPGYNNGAIEPVLGCWSASRLTVSTLWYQQGNLDRDFGAANMADNGTRLTGKIGTRTGWLGFAWNQARQQHYLAFGYPAGSPFNGQRLVTCAAEFAFTENGRTGYVDSQSIGCDMTGGSSGGPWIWRFQNGNYINGHNDWRFTARPLEMNSPYFDDLANNVRLAAL
jgi:V8-like Glu-specific endopeptidase